MKQSVLVLTLFVLMACDRRPQGHWQVGRFRIDSEDSKLRQQIVQVMYPENKILEAGLIQMKRSYVFAAILEKAGHQIQPQNLIEEDQRIEATSRDRAMLLKIKDVFKKPDGSFDRERYLTVFILPVYVERILPGVFQGLSVHQESSKIATEFLHEVQKKPESFSSLAKQRGLNYGQWCVSREEGLRFSSGAAADRTPKRKAPALIDLSAVPNQVTRDAVQKTMLSSEVELVQKWMTEIVAPRALGQVVPHLIDYYSEWLVLRLSHKARDRACFEAVVVKKVQFESWLEEQKTLVKVHWVQ